MSAPADRRGFLRGLAALPLIGGGVALAIDPVFAAIERHRAAWITVQLDADGEPINGTPERFARSDLLDTPPSTTLGLRTLIDYVDWHQAHGDMYLAEDVFDTIACSCRLLFPSTLSAAGVPLTGGRA